MKYSDITINHLLAALGVIIVLLVISVLAGGDDIWSIALTAIAGLLGVMLGAKLYAKNKRGVGSNKKQIEVAPSSHVV